MFRITAALIQPAYTVHQKRWNWLLKALEVNLNQSEISIDRFVADISATRKEEI